MSTIVDGTMLKAANEELLKNRQVFLAKQGVTTDQTMLVRLTYNDDDYRRYYVVGAEQAGDGIVYPSSVETDALFTKDKNLALLLPVADCIGAVLYDPTNEVLGLAHLGRHNLLQIGGSGIVEYMVNEFGSKASELKVWLSPAAGRENYPLYDFGNRSMHEVATEQLQAAGVDAGNITIDLRDTTADESLFSHSEFLKGNRSLDGRQAVVTMMKLS